MVGAMTTLTKLSPLDWAEKTLQTFIHQQPILDVKWAYEWSVVLFGALATWRLTQDPRYFEYIQQNINHFVQPDGTITTYRQDDYNIDNINPGKLLFPLFEATGDSRYEKAIFTLRDQLEKHPRTNSGGFWHKKIYPYQMWLDGAYMAAPFRAEYAQKYNQPALFDDIIHQLKLLTERTYDPQTGLLYHGWDESIQQKWADPQTGQSAHFWVRAVGWYVMALVDVLDYLPPQHPDTPPLIDYLQRTVDSLLRFQDAPTGLWYQIIDQGQREGNYLESSGTSMIVYSLAKGIKAGHLSGEVYRAAAEKAYHGLVTHQAEMDDNGSVQVHRICSVAGLGGTPYRDGTFEYYMSEPVVTNDHKGVGAFILACAAMAALD